MKSKCVHDNIPQGSTRMSTHFEVASYLWEPISRVHMQDKLKKFGNLPMQTSSVYLLYIGSTRWSTLTGNLSGQIWAQPSFHFFESLAFTLGNTLYLLFSNFTNSKIFRVGMSKVPARNGCRR